MVKNFGTFYDETRQTISDRIHALRYPVNSAESSTSSTSSTYEELLKGCVPCPTCKGSGKVEAELEAQLVAFLPVNDERLNPRTKLKVGVVITVCVLVTSLTIAFLLPRSVTVRTRSRPITPVKFEENEQTKSVMMLIQYHFNISNANFYPVKMTYSAVDSLFDKKKISHGTNKTRIWIPLRSTYEHFIVLNVTFDSGTQGGFMYCKYRGSIPLEFDLGVSVEYLGHKQQMGLEAVQDVNCFQEPADVEGF